MKVVVIGNMDNSRCIYIYHYVKGIKQDWPPIARFIDYFLYFLTRLVQNFLQYIYRSEKAGF